MENGSVVFKPDTIGDPSCTLIHEQQAGGMAISCSLAFSVAETKRTHETLGGR